MLNFSEVLKFTKKFSARFENEFTAEMKAIGLKLEKLKQISKAQAPSKFGFLCGTPNNARSQSIDHQITELNQ